jgi:beta-xylosidase
MAMSAYSYGVTVTSGEFFRIYDPSVGEKETWYINDHCFVRGPDGIWHLFGITHAEPANPLDEDNFAHATALKLTQGQWEKQPFALTVDPNVGETHLWAPHVILNDGTYYMFYCAGDNDHSKYKIHLATSKDLKSWRRHPANPMVVDGFDARDPYILKIGNEWAMYYTANSEPNGGNHIVACRKSKDLIHWGDRTTVFTAPLRGTYGGPTESPFVVAHKGKYYLFVCTNVPYDNTAVYESKSPFHWDIKRKVGDIPAHCAEVIFSGDEWYISRAGWGRGGVYLAKLYWNDCPTDVNAPSPISKEVGR